MLLAALCLATGVAPASADGLPLPSSVTGLPLPVVPIPSVPGKPSGQGLPVPGALDQQHGLAGTASFDHGLYVHYCPGGEFGPRAAASHTSWAGWPAKQCLKMDKGPAGASHTLVGLNGVHNWLLGGYGNDLIIGGDAGDVIWADYHPGGERLQTATIHAGNGRNVIYANDTHNYVWTGSNPATIVHAHNPGTSGTIHCGSPAQVIYLSTISQQHFKLDGCHRISHFTLGY